MVDQDKNDGGQDLGHRIKTLRRSAGLTQAKLGDALGVTFQQVQKYESGRSRIAAEKLQKIANALGVDVGTLYEDRPAKPHREHHGSAALTQGSFESGVFHAYFDQIRDPRARYLLAELARVFSEIESHK